MRASIRPSEQQRLQRIIKLFDTLFFDSHKTRLIGGAKEPIYLPSKTAHQPHRLLFRENYISSALHEVAHWCIAGSERLLKEDFGYWYQPDGRSSTQQRQFESVEVKPQALEWMFSIACGQRFTISADNLGATEAADMVANHAFKMAVIEQSTAWCQTGQMPSRAKTFINALVATFGSGDPCNPQHYQLNLLN